MELFCLSILLTVPFEEKGFDFYSQIFRSPKNFLKVVPFEI